MPERDFLEYVEAFCKRPKMYTSKGSFDEAVALLEGFGMGANVGEHCYHSAFTPFHLWMVKKFSIPKIIINWNDFREKFSSDEEALQNLPILYREYVESLAFQD